MPAWVRRTLIFLRSLRFKTLALLGGSALMAATTCLALIDGIQRADRYMERISASQGQLEMLILLSGRVSDYAIAVGELSIAPEESRARMASATSQVNAVFERLDRAIEYQVNILDSDEARNAEATESLSVARMRAMFQNLDRQVYAVLERRQDPKNTSESIKSIMDVFGIGFSPMLAQAIEDERSEIGATRRAMETLKQSLTTVAAAVLAGALALAALLYFGPVASILRRTTEIVSGARAISSGRLDTRLRLKGHDEFTMLMASFNRMAVNLARRENRLLEAQQHLQEIVEERTQELRTANRKLEEIDRNRRRFFADVSHELRTPLTVILGESEVTLRQGGDKLSGSLRKSMETIQARARRLNRRIEDLLRVARSESGKVDLNLARTEIGIVLTDAYEDIAALARQRNMTIDLDAGPGDIYLNGDKDWLRQVFSGLMANAIKYSATGELIRVRAERRGRMVSVEVSDRGCGIAAEELPRVFNRFHKGKNQPSTQETSHGVGLALAKWVVEEHHGRIELLSPSLLYNSTTVDSRRGVSVIVTLNQIDAEQPMSDLKSFAVSSDSGVAAAGLKYES